MTDEKALLALAERIGLKLGEAFVAGVQHAIEAGAEVKARGPAVQQQLLAMQGEEIVAQIPLSDGTEFAVGARFVAELARTYPSVDVPATLAEARLKITTKSVSAPTRRGAPRFVGDWIHREQNYIVAREARGEQFRGNGGRKA